MRKTTSGFTIVELLIVIVVIAILAAISIVAYNGIQERSRAAAIVARAEAYIKGIKLWAADTGSYPTPGSCIAPATYTTCANVSGWGANQVNDAGFNSTLATYSGVSTPQLSVYGPDSPIGLMAYHPSWWSTGKPALMYSVGPSSDCVLGPLLDSTHNTLAPAGQTYTSRTSTYTRCEVQIN